LAVQGSYIANNYHPIAGMNKSGQDWTSLDMSHSANKSLE